MMFRSVKMAALVAALAIPLLLLGACDRTITRVEQVNEATRCFDCHSDQNTFLVAADTQWQNSIHASGFNLDRATSSSCAGCHGSEGFIQRVNGEEVTGGDNPTVIHCFTCHAPHTNSDFRLRWTEAATLQNGATFDLGAGNLCVFCHQARRNVDTYVGTAGTERVTFTSTHWGPHPSVQGDMLLGSNGYEYSGYSYEITAHGVVTEDGCVDCHKSGGTSNNVVGGHTFNMRWTLIDHHGQAEEILNTDACAACHGDLDDFNLGGVQDSVETLIATLESLVTAAGLWTDGHPIPGVTTSADSAGAVWNLLMAEEDRSKGVHNRKYIMGLLDSAIRFMQGTRPLQSQVATPSRPWEEEVRWKR